MSYREQRMDYIIEGKKRKGGLHLNFGIFNTQESMKTIARLSALSTEVGLSILWSWFIFSTLLWFLLLPKPSFNLLWNSDFPSLISSFWVLQLLLTEEISFQLQLTRPLTTVILPSLSLAFMFLLKDEAKPAHRQFSWYFECLDHINCINFLHSYKVSISQLG